MYKAMAIITTQAYKTVFGHMIPILDKDVRSTPIDLGSFETLKEAEKAVAKDSGLNRTFLNTAGKRRVIHGSWRKTWCGRFKTDYVISEI